MSATSSERLTIVATSRWNTRVGRAAWRLHWAGALVCLMAVCAVYHWAIYVPHPDRPHVLTILDRVANVGIAAAMLLSALLLGLRCLALLHLIDTSSRAELVGLAAGTGLGLMSLGVLGLGMMHLYYPLVFAILLTILPWCLRKELGLLRNLLPDRHTLATSGQLKSISFWNRSTQVYLAVVSVIMLGFVFFRDMTVPSVWTGYDSYQYHWAVPALLLQSHGMRAFPGWAHANLPFNTEMLNLVALSFHAPEAALLIQDIFGLLTAILIYAVVRRHFTAIAAWLAVTAYATVPLYITYTSQSLVETAVVYYGFAAMLLLVRWLATLLRTGSQNYHLLALGGMFLGFAMGAKYTALEYLPGTVLLLLVGIAIYARQASTQSSRKWKGAAFAFLMFGVAAVGTFMPWALKNWLLLGNPFYPALASLFPTPLWDTARTQTLQATFDSFGPHAGWVHDFHLFAVELFLHPGPYGEGIAFLISPLGLAAAVAPFVIGGRIIYRRARLAGQELEQALFLGALTIATTSSFGVWTASGALVERYALPAVLLATVLGVVLLAWPLMWQGSRSIHVGRFSVTLAIVFCSLQASFIFASSYPRDPTPLLTGQVSERTAIRSRMPDNLPTEFWRMTDYVNNDLPHNGRLLMLGRGSGYFFTDRDYVADSGGDWVPYLVSKGRTESGMLALLHQQHFTYVVYDATLMQFLTEIYHNHVLASYLPTYLDFQRHRLILVKDYGAIAIYRVP